MDFLNLKYPILQAPIGSAATVNLAATVSNSGGMGSLPLTWEEPEDVERSVKNLREQTSHFFFVNFVVGFPSVSIERNLEIALEAGAPIVTFSWGQPGKLIDYVHRNNALVGVQTGSVAGAKQAVDDGTDFVICQGSEAGGHVQSTTPLSDLLPSVVRSFDSVPIVAAGGLSNGRDLAYILDEGASGMMLGTRFVATAESIAHPDYKNALLKAQAKDSVYTQCFNRLWPNASHRVLRNKTLNEWEAAGCPQPGERPGEDEILAECSINGTMVRYDDHPPVETTKGQVLECSLYAGTGCGSINSIPKVDKLLSDIWSEYQSISDSDS